MNRIERLSQRLREQLGIPEDTLIESLDVLRRLKIAKVIGDFREDISLTDAQDARWDVDDRVILFSPALWAQIHSEDGPESRFTVFHEIGHAVLGHQARNRLKLGRLQHGRFIESDETQADEFAIAFAIPLYFAAELIEKSHPDIARQFGLTAAMASRRLVDLQRASRNAGRVREQVEDNYAEAMSALRVNALNWNSK